MLIETRLQQIVAMVEQNRSVTVQEVMEKLHASESTVRRDLNTLDARGLLIKVHGGAVAKEGNYHTREPEFVVRKELCVEEKVRIAKYAASLVEPYDFVYLDAGSTTEIIINYIYDKTVTFVTNAVSHAEKLAKNGFTVYVLGGKFKSRTGAIVGDEALDRLSQYNFTKGFFGCNGVDSVKGITAPEIAEASVKRKAVLQCEKAFILADSTKFNTVSAVKFAEFGAVTIVTDKYKDDTYRDYKNVVEVSEQ